MKACFTFCLFALSYTLIHAVLSIYAQQISWFRKQRHYLRAENRLLHLLPQTCLQLSSFLKAGHAIPQALKHMTKQASGNTLYQLLFSADRKCISGELNTFILYIKNAIQLSHKQGISLAEILEKLSTLARNQATSAQKMALLSYPLKAQATIAILLPWFVLLILGLMDPMMITNAFAQTTGVVGFSTAFIMESVAIIWIRRLLQ